MKEKLQNIQKTVHRILVIAMTVYVLMFLFYILSSLHPVLHSVVTCALYRWAFAISTLLCAVTGVSDRYLTRRIESFPLTKEEEAGQQAEIEELKKQLQ